MKKMTPEEFKSAQALIELLAERWPHAFSVYQLRRKPLKIGIHHEIVAALDVTSEQLGLALRVYVSNTGYLKSFTRPGAMRVGLDGVAVTAGTAEEAAHAAARLSKRAMKQAAEEADENLLSELAGSESSSIGAQKKQRRLNA